MCGIVGYVNYLDSPDPSLVQLMSHAIAHRGPDAHSLWKDEDCVLAHRRLSIIDLSENGLQPMTNDKQSLVIVFNGEIYNYKELRKELIDLGYHFKSTSDTEVLLHGFHAWSEKICSRLRGMFSFAIWDRDEKKLFVARDPLGKKPFFYRHEKGLFKFASELYAFKFDSDPCNLSHESLRDYIEFGYVLENRTLFSEISKLPAGHYGVLNNSGFVLRRYAPLCREMLPGNNDSENLESILSEAVKLRLEADVPVGCFLSGGIDSSLIATLAQKEMTQQLRTFCVRFDDTEQGDACYSRLIADRLHTSHHELELSQKTILGEFEKVLALQPEPLGDDSFIPTYFISRETQQHVKVVLSGDGGDEFFCGYDKYAQFAIARHLLCIPRPLLRALQHLPLKDMQAKILHALFSANQDQAMLARWLSALWKKEEVTMLLGPTENRENDFNQIWHLNRPVSSPIRQFMFTDVETYLEGDILAKVDRASMANSLEVRCPLLDQKVIRSSLHFKNCDTIIPSRKKPLKEILWRYFPHKFFERKKSGFGMPMDAWFRNELRDLLCDYTADAFLDDWPIDKKCLRRYREMHLNGHRNYGRKLYAILALVIWWKKWSS